MNTAVVDLNWHKYVDLGLPSGNLWAECNVGAENPLDEGLMFNWGNPKPCMSKLEIKKIDENIKLLKGKKYDMVSANMGGDWVLPYINDVHELFNHCTFDNHCMDDGKLFVIATSGINGKQLTFPCYRGFDDGWFRMDNFGVYWVNGFHTGGYNPSLFYFSTYDRIGDGWSQSDCTFYSRGVIRKAKDAHKIRKKQTN